MARKKRLKQVPESHQWDINCKRHGVTACCFICQHLHSEDDLGYYAIRPEPDEPSMAWCEECDRMLEQDRGWSDRATAAAGWKVYCTCCWEETLARHELRSWIRGRNPEDFE